MQLSRILKTGFLSLAFLGLTACGNTNNFALLDDPTQEPVGLQDSPPPPPDFPETPSQPPKVDEPPGSILDKYAHLDPDGLIQEKHLVAALTYFEKNKANIKNQNYLSVIDFSKSSKSKRFFVVNMKTGDVWAIHTAHGKGSDADHDSYAEKFSNTSGSNASSLGIYRTAETYYGEHNLSLRLDGMSSTNSNARARAVVIHGADYVQEANVTQGRSWGCPAVALELRTELIEKIKNDSVIYAGI